MAIKRLVRERHQQRLGWVCVCARDRWPEINASLQQINSQENGVYSRQHVYTHTTRPETHLATN